MPRTVDPQKSLQLKTMHGCVPVGAVHSRLHLLRQLQRVSENDGMCVTASTSMVRLEVVTLWAPLSSYTVLPPFLTVNPPSDLSHVTVLSV